MSITQPKLFIVQADVLPDVLPAIEATVPLIKTFVFKTSSEGIAPRSCRCWSDLLQYGEQDWTRINDEETAKATIAVLQSTSGTTGLPKVAATSHYALVAAGVAIQESNQRSYEVTRLISLPLFHSFGTSFVQISAFHYGEPTYIMRRFSARISPVLWTDPTSRRLRLYLP